MSGRNAGKSARATERQPVSLRRAGRRGANRIESSAVRYLAVRDRTEAQLRAYLTKVGASPSRIRALITRFRARGYLNDEAFAVQWARSRLARRPMGRARLEAELLRQGVARHTTTRTLDLMYGEVSERELACRLVRHAIPHRAELVRCAERLRRRGFSEETIEAVLSGAKSDWYMEHR